MEKPTLYILTGRSFAGKSTLRKALVERFGFSVASVDWNIDKHHMHVPDMTQDDWNFVYSQTYERLKQLLKDGKTTILDLGNLKRSERDTARKIAQELGVSYKLIYVNTNEEEVRKRWEENKAAEDGRKMDEGSFNKAQVMFEEPTPDENPIVYNTEMDFNGWIKENIETSSLIQ